MGIFDLFKRRPARPETPVVAEKAIEEKACYDSAPNAYAPNAGFVRLANIARAAHVKTLVVRGFADKNGFEVVRIGNSRHYFMNRADAVKVYCDIINEKARNCGNGNG